MCRSITKSLCSLKTIKAAEGAGLRSSRSFASAFIFAWRIFICTRFRTSVLSVSSLMLPKSLTWQIVLSSYNRRLIEVGFWVSVRTLKIVTMLIHEVVGDEYPRIKTIICCNKFSKTKPRMDFSFYQTSENYNLYRLSVLNCVMEILLFSRMAFTHLGARPRPLHLSRPSGFLYL